MVNARYCRHLSFTTLTMGDDIYRVVVSESKSGPTRLNSGHVNLFRCQTAPVNIFTYHIQ